MEEGKRKGIKLFGVVSTFPSFLKVSFDVCENSSLTVEDIHSDRLFRGKCERGQANNSLG